MNFDREIRNILENAGVKILEYFDRNSRYMDSRYRGSRYSILTFDSYEEDFKNKNIDFMDAYFTDDTLNKNEIINFIREFYENGDIMFVIKYDQKYDKKNFDIININPKIIFQTDNPKKSNINYIIHCIKKS